MLVEFDPAGRHLRALLAAFFKIHDPTTTDRQGPDEGDQYRSVIFTFSPAQDAAAARAGEEAQRASGARHDRSHRIGRFWKAEGYHQQYDEKTGRRLVPAAGRRRAGDVATGWAYRRP